MVEEIFALRSFICSLLRAEAQPTLDRNMVSSLRPCCGPVRLPRDRREISRCVMCVCATCGEGGLSRSEQLVVYF